MTAKPLRARQELDVASVFLSNYENTPAERALARRGVLRVARDTGAGAAAAVLVLEALRLT